MQFRRLATALFLSHIASTVLISPALGNVQLTGPYLEDFQSMGPSGTTTPANWFVGATNGLGNGAISDTTIAVDNGTYAAGDPGAIGNYNYGNIGSAARSLGTLASSTVGGNRGMEVRVDNKTGQPLTAFEVRYDGKQWHRDDTVAQVLILRYSTDGVNFTDMGPAFTFTSPQLGSRTALNGDDTANRVNDIGGTFVPNSPIANDATFYLRWYDANDVGLGSPGTELEFAL